MEPYVVAKGLDGDHRRAVADRVIAAFEHSLPNLRLLIYLDEKDCRALKDNGAANRGIFYPVDKVTAQYSVLLQMGNLLGEGDGAAPYANDCAIYLHNGSCSDEVGLAMCLAHELQHFKQYGFNRKAWTANNLVTRFLRQTDNACKFTSGEIASEHEAKIVGKRIAERLYSPGLVREYIEVWKSRAVNETDADDSDFVQAINPHREFDLGIETRRMYQQLKRYRRELTDCYLENPTFAEVDLAELFLGAAELALAEPVAPFRRMVGDKVYRFTSQGEIGVG